MEHLDTYCFYCGNDCSYGGSGTVIEHIANLLIPVISHRRRFIEIIIIDWILKMVVYEDETLTGEISVMNWRNPEDDFIIKNYFTAPVYSFDEKPYIKRLLEEVKMWHDMDELHDGLHPVTIKTIIN